MKSTNKTNKTNTALCGLLSGLLLLAAGSPKSQAASIVYAWETPSWTNSPGYSLSGTITIDDSNLTTVPLPLWQAIVQSYSIVLVGPSGPVVNFPLTEANSQFSPSFDFGSSGLFITTTSIYFSIDPFETQQNVNSSLYVQGLGPTYSPFTYYEWNTFLDTESGFSGQWLEVGTTPIVGQGYVSPIDSSLIESWAPGDSVVTVLATVTTIPEPTSAALLLGSGAMLLLRRRRAAV